MTDLFAAVTAGSPLAIGTTNHRPVHRLVERASQLLLWIEPRLKRKRDPHGPSGDERGAVAVAQLPNPRARVWADAVMRFRRQADQFGAFFLAKAVVAAIAANAIAGVRLDQTGH